MSSDNRSCKTNEQVSTIGFRDMVRDINVVWTVRVVSFNARLKTLILQAKFILISPYPCAGCLTFLCMMIVLVFTLQEQAAIPEPCL